MPKDGDAWGLNQARHCAATSGQAVGESTILANTSSVVVSNKAPINRIKSHCCSAEKPRRGGRCTVARAVGRLGANPIAARFWARRAASCGGNRWVDWPVSSLISSVIGVKSEVIPLYPRCATIAVAPKYSIESRCQAKLITKTGVSLPMSMSKSSKVTVIYSAKIGAYPQKLKLIGLTISDKIKRHAIIGQILLSG